MMAATEASALQRRAGSHTQCQALLQISGRGAASKAAGGLALSQFTPAGKLHTDREALI